MNLPTVIRVHPRAAILEDLRVALDDPNPPELYADVVAELLHLRAQVTHLQATATALLGRARAAEASHPPAP